MTTNLNSGLRILTGISGHLPSRLNDVLYHASTHSSNQKEFKGSLVFFPGDVQDLHDLQSKHRDNVRYIQWSLENTTKLLAQYFPTRNIFVIRPVRKELATFSCYDNFVTSDKIGNPTYSSDHGALEHLAGLLSNCCAQIELEPKEALRSLVIVGFSKGIVVLNQLIHELAHFKENSKPVPEPIRDLRRFVWLDGGHNGGPGSIYVTNPGVLKAFASYGIQADIRVTPYQDQDSRRPWIHKECKSFARMLGQLNVEVKRQLYFEDEPPSIDVHFDIIKTLKDNDW
eukprot:TRINITY_DN7440_c0_g1_i2.p1 TRINITY_DN7440_c0_g1~~TRINITY_DN7440_c0_g1_i2.p1  ORF type:complete len:295 (-),score=33.18 TRINITY_DN7440_c0_g1_i2:97-951(-)